MSKGLNPMILALWVMAAAVNVSMAAPAPPAKTYADRIDELLPDLTGLFDAPRATTP